MGADCKSAGYAYASSDIDRTLESVKIIEYILGDNFDA